MKENDIIGFRANSPLVYFGISFLVGLALIAVCIIVPLAGGRGLSPWMIVLLILGAILFCIGAVCFVRVLKTPDPAIYVEDGKLCIADVCIPIGMIVDVRCRPAKSRLITCTWGADRRRISGRGSQVQLCRPCGGRLRAHPSPHRGI